MAWLLLASLIVATAVGLRALHVLGQTVQERDEALWGQEQLIEQNKRLYDANVIIAAQNLRLINYHNARDALDIEPDTFSGNIFETE